MLTGLVKVYDGDKTIELRPQSEAYLELLEEMAVLHVRKAMGYSSHSKDVWANFRGSQDIGISAFRGVLVRWLDKVARIKNLVRDERNDVLPDEGLEDTLMDAAAYALIALSLLREERLTQGSPLGEPDDD